MTKCQCFSAAVYLKLAVQAEVGGANEGWSPMITAASLQTLRKCFGEANLVETDSLPTALCPQRTNE